MTQFYRFGCTGLLKGIAATAIKVLFCLLQLLAFGCTSLQETSKYDFTKGTYTVRAKGEPTVRAYVDIEEDTIAIYPLRDTKEGQVAEPDSATSVLTETPTVLAPGMMPVYTFSNSSFDVDVLTIPFTYRPPTSGFPQQLNTNFQGAVYLGGRRDIFRVRYKRAPVQHYHRKITHFGYSLGIFTGVGASTINEFVTQGAIGYEYEGMVWLNGIAGIVGVNNITLGLAVGLDHLFDRNRHDWIYQHKPWIGLAFGLNLN